MTNTAIQKEVCSEIRALLKTKLYHPHRQGREFDDLLAEFDTHCAIPTSSDAFEPSVNRALKPLNASFWRGTGTNLTAQFGINATLRRFDEQWMFMNILEGGSAQRAGIQAGEVLLAVDGQALLEHEPAFALGREFKLSVLARDGRTVRSVTIALPGVGPKNRPPMIEPTSVVSSIRGRTGLLKVAAFPGIVGFDFARRINSAVRQFNSQNCDRLIVDLRGNCGGGLGSLRLMSYFTPAKVPVGYSLTRAARDADRRPEQLTVIDKIPNSKIALYAMALKFRFVQKDRSIRLVTEGLGAQPFHGRIVLLIDEYTRSGAEMVAAFARERGLARLVGAKTPGQTLGAANFTVGSEYRLRIPLVGWYTAKDEVIEGLGVRPDVNVPLTVEDLRSGTDRVLSVANQVVESL